MMRTQGSRRRAGRGLRGAFTVIELLVVVAIIVLLLGLLMVGLNAASKAAQVANTRFLMQSMATALAQFQKDMGYLPPVLGPRGTALASPAYAGGGNPSPVGSSGYCRDLLPSTDGTSMALADAQLWNSFTSPAEYLLGYGNRAADGYGVIRTAATQGAGGTVLNGARETPLIGLRHPGRDGVWGSLLTPALVPAAGYVNPYAGGYGRRMLPQDNLESPSSPTSAAGMRDIPRYQAARGRVFGPYLELKDDHLLRGITGVDAAGEPILVTTEEVPAGTDFDLLPKCVVDYWGRPIRYYRNPYASGEPGLPLTNTPWTVADYFAIRPTSIPEGEDIDGQLADANADPSSTRSLRTAEFALLSYGPDRSWERTMRIDPAGYNADNIVETGP